MMMVDRSNSGVVTHLKEASENTLHQDKRMHSGRSYVDEYGKVCKPLSHLLFLALEAPCIDNGQTRSTD